MRFKFTIGKKLVLLYVATVALGVVIFGLVATEIVSNNIQQQTARQAEDLRKQARLRIGEDARMLDDVLGRRLRYMAVEVELGVSEGIGDVVRRMGEDAARRRAIAARLQRLGRILRVDLLTLVGPDGRTLCRASKRGSGGDFVWNKSYSKDKPPAADLAALLRRAMNGEQTAGFEVLPAKVLEPEAAGLAEEGEETYQNLAEKAAVVFVGEDGKPSPHEKRTREDRALAMTVFQPVYDSSKRVVAAAVAAKMVNHNERLLQLGVGRKGSIVSIYLGPVCVAVDNEKEAGARGVGTTASPEVVQAIYGSSAEGKKAEAPELMRELTVYHLIEDTSARPVGALSVHIPTAKFALGLAGQKLTENVVRASSREIIWLTAITAGVLGLGITILNAVRISKPLSELVRFSEAIAAGDLAVQAPVRGSDEVAALAESMNTMALELARSYAQLEEKVRERTRSLRASEQRYRDLIENAPDMIHTMDTEYNILSANQREVQTLGYSRRELTRRNLRDLVSPEYWETTREALDETFQGKDVVRCETVLLAKDKRRIPVEALAAARREDGRCVEARVILRDITERVEAQREITQLAHTVRSINDGVVITDFHCKITFINEPFQRTFGWHPEDVIGRHVFEIHSDKNPAWVNADILEGAYETQAGWRGEILIKNGDGEEVPVYMTISSVRDEQDQFVAMVSVFRDITEQKRLQQQLIQSERLSAVGEMISGVAHEIRNPLNTLVITVHNLRADISRFEEHEEGKRQYMESVDIIASELDRLNRILEDFMRVARMPEVMLEECKLEALIETILKTARPQAKSSGVRIKTAFPAKRRAVLGDSELLHQAFLNIILNAIEAMTEGGELEIDAEYGDEEVVVSFRDTGPGIPKEHLQKIFDIFFSTKTTGTGIGLSVVYRIVRAHGGSIECESEPGQGTTFYVRLPYQPAATLAGIEEAST